MSTIPQDLTAAKVIEVIGSGVYPRDVVLTIARGFLPLPQEELIAVFAYLALSTDSEIAASARASLAEVPGRALYDYATTETAEPAHLVRLTQVVEEPLVLEALIRNRAFPDETIIELARSAEDRLQEVIVINQARILRAPAILDALFDNPRLSPDVRRRALETKEEFFDKKGRQQIREDAAPVEEEELSDIPLDEIADLLERAKEEEERGTAPSAPPISESERKDPDKASLWGRLHFMTVSEKVQLAFKGDRTARAILIRERNKLICSAVMRNPRINEQEVEQIAGMRNVEEEVLRIIGMKRDWTAKYNIILTLCRNPKAPLGVVLPFVNRLTLRDLKALKDDKGAQNVIRDMARKTYLARAHKN
ncbi:MAG TPA: hypothetical protein VF701_15595 [Thermoanaerobaculia bacterium]